MDILRSPWRYDYVSSASEPRACILCIETTSATSGTAGTSGQDSPVQDLPLDDSPLKRDADQLILYRGKLNFVIMNLYPYTSGHLMVSPYRHVGDLSDATPPELSEMMELARKCAGILGDAYAPEGFNIGMNVGHCAGAGVRNHLHLHVVPRWCGDANFMTSTSETRVLPEDVQDGYLRLRPLFGS